MSRFRWNRWDQAVFEGLLVAAIAVVLVIGLLPALATGSGLCAARRISKCESRIFVEAYLDRSLPLTEGGLVSPRGERAGIVGIGETTVTLIFADPTPAQRLLYAVPVVLGTVIILLVLMLLLGIARTLRSGDPFVAGNARRVTAIAVLALIGGIATQLVGQYARAKLLQAPGVPEEFTPVFFELSFLPVIVGLPLAFFAEVFRRGTKLREDVEGLV